VNTGVLNDVLLVSTLTARGAAYVLTQMIISVGGIELNPFAQLAWYVPAAATVAAVIILWASVRRWPGFVWAWVASSLVFFDAAHDLLVVLNP
jgi:hypothetical protein